MTNTFECKVRVTNMVIKGSVPMFPTDDKDSEYAQVKIVGKYWDGDCYNDTNFTLHFSTFKEAVAYSEKITLGKEYNIKGRLDLFNKSTSEDGSAVFYQTVYVPETIKEAEAESSGD